MSQSSPVITIDGPSGAGKGTVARCVAEKLGWHILDSGAIYRVLGVAALQNNVALDNEGDLAALAHRLDVRFQPNPDGEGLLTLLADDDISLTIRSEEAGMAASNVAALPQVRQALLAFQQSFAQTPGLVADGRDMGTVVFQNAGLKVFLTASVEARAKRRQKQLIEKGLDGNLARLSEAIQARDEADMGRKTAPLKAADDAVLIDSTHLTIDQVMAQILDLALQRFNLVTS